MNATPTPVQTAIQETPAYPTPADTLRRAAEYLRRYGWIQNRYYDDPNRPSPSACALGALYIVTHGRPNPQPYTDRSESVV